MMIANIVSDAFISPSLLYPYTLLQLSAASTSDLPQGCPLPQEPGLEVLVNQ